MGYFPKYVPHIPVYFFMNFEIFGYFLQRMGKNSSMGIHVSTVHSRLWDLSVPTKLCFASVETIRLPVRSKMFQLKYSTDTR